MIHAVRAMVVVTLISVGNLFYFETASAEITIDGEIATYQRIAGGSTFVLPQDSEYERVHGVTEVQTHRSLSHWRAYNETTLLGLNPSKSYLLDNTPRNLSQVHINSLPTGVSVTETRVTEDAAFFRLENPNVSLEIDLLSKLHLARTGTVINRIELPIERGATFIESENTLAGITKKAIDAHPPYQGGSGDTFGEFTLSMPDSPDIRLQLYIGLWGGSERSDGVTFIVSVQGDEIFRQHYNQRKWQPVTLNLSPYRGKDVKLRFTTNPGPNDNAGWDWAVWGAPKIISKPDNSLTKIGFFSPVEPTASLPNTLRHTGSEQYTLEANLSQPVIIFFAPFQQINLPYNLRKAKLNAGLQFEGVFRFGDLHGSGTPRTTTIDNIRKETIFAHPPARGQTVLQFPLSLPKEPCIFSFSAGIDEGCSRGVLFQIRLNGQLYFETCKDTFNWTDGDISLSEFAGQPVLLELVTDPADSGLAGADCDWAHWADLHITATPTPALWDTNQ